MSAKKNCIITIELEQTAYGLLPLISMERQLASMKGSLSHLSYRTGLTANRIRSRYSYTMLYVLKNLLNEHIHPHKIKRGVYLFQRYMHSVLVIDKSGVPMGNVMTWVRQPREERSQAIKRFKRW
jgi:gluconokinase